MENIRHEFEQELQSNSLRLTGQRKLIYGVLCENKDKHLTVEEIHSILVKKGSGISVATVYRTLALLEEHRLAGRLCLNDGCVRYQLLDPSEKHEHHHLVCERCGKVIDVMSDMMDAVEHQALCEYGFQVKNHKVKLYGICKECRLKEESRASEANKEPVFRLSRR